MHFHRKSTCLNGIKVLVILLITHSTTVSSALTPEEIADAVNEASPNRYCGKRLTEAMRSFCTPIMRNLIMKQGNMPVKKSLDSNADVDFEFDLDRIAAENYDDDLLRSRYKIDDPFMSNDIPFMMSSQGNGNRRRRRGIIDECCKRACYKTELVRYCPQKG